MKKLKIGKLLSLVLAMTVLVTAFKGISFPVSSAEVISNGENVITDLGEIVEGTNILMSNIFGTKSFTSGKYIIDLDGYEWDGQIFVSGTADVTIMDSSASKTGVFDATTMGDGIDVSGGKITLDGVKVIGGFGSSDALFVSGGTVVSNNSILCAGKAGIDIANASASVTVNGGTFANFPGTSGYPVDERNCAIEFRNNASITLNGDINFEVSRVICRDGHTNSFADSIMVGEDVTVAFTEASRFTSNAYYQYSDMTYTYGEGEIGGGGGSTEPVLPDVSVEIISPSEIVEGTNILTAKIYGTKTFTSGKYVIDLAGYVWDGQLFVSGTADVTVIDSSAAKTGMIDSFYWGDAIDISGGKLTLEGIEISGAEGAGDALVVSGGVISVKECRLSSGKAAINITSAVADVVVEDTIFAVFNYPKGGSAIVLPPLSVSYNARATMVTSDSRYADPYGRNCAIELNNNAVITLKGNNVFANNVVICNSDTHTKLWTDSIILGKNVTVIFDAEDTDLGSSSGNPYKANTITYTYNADGTVEKIDLSDATLELEYTSAYYEGSALKPSVTLTYNGKTYNSAEELNITYVNNDKIGTATVIVEGINNFTGTVELQFEIKEKIVPPTENTVEDPSEIVEGTNILTSNIVGNRTFTSGKYIIDLAGYEWEGQLIILGTADVTVIDSSAEKTGIIDATQIGDAIDISGGKITLDGVTVLGACGSGDAVWITGDSNVTIKNCVLASGKAGIDLASAQATVVVENTTFAEFERLVPGQPVDSCGRNCAIEFRHNATITLKGKNVFENNTIICRSSTHTKSWADSIILGENVTVTFDVEDTDLGLSSGNPYKANTITYTYNADGTVEKIDLSDATLELEYTSAYYEGSALKPSVTLTYNGKTYNSAEELNITYVNNDKIGTATVIVEGINNFAGTVELQFEIKEKIVPPTENTVEDPSEIVEGTNILTSNIVGNKTFTSGKYIIDLAGYVWEGQLIISGTADVTVIDSSIAKTGIIDSFYWGDAITVSGGILTLDGIEISGSGGTGDAIFVSGGIVSIKGCKLSSGKAAVNITSATADVVVEDTTFANFDPVQGGDSVDLPIIPLSDFSDETAIMTASYNEYTDPYGRNCAIELSNNATIMLKGNNVFENNIIIRKTVTHTKSWADSIVVGENVTITFDLEDTDLGCGSGNQYHANKITYTYGEGEFVVPNKIDNLVAIGKKGSISLTWNQSSEKDTNTYNIYRKAENESGYQLIKTIVGRDILLYEDTAVEKEITYSYFVTGVGLYGAESEPSFIAFATVRTNHNEGDWLIEKETTPFEEGIRIKRCTICGEIVATESIPMLVDKSGITLDNDEQIICDIPEYLFTAEALKSHYEALGCEVEVYDKNLNKVERISTGGYIMCDGKKYTTVIYGDTTGDGHINLFDLLSMLDHVNGSVLLDGAYKKAGMVGKGDDINIFDIFTILDYINAPSDNGSIII